MLVDRALENPDSTNMELRFLIERSVNRSDTGEGIKSVNHNNEHLDEESANKVMEHILYVDRENVTHDTPFWTVGEIESLTKDLYFPNGTTKWDKWVGFNFFYADTCRVLNARQAIEAGHQFYFNDIDAPENKLYKYLEAMGTI